MKRFTKTIGWFGMLAMLFVLPSCKDYLDRENQSTVSPTDAFKNFVNFQGFVEELYYLSLIHI